MVVTKSGCLSHGICTDSLIKDSLKFSDMKESVPGEYGEQATSTLVRFPNCIVYYNLYKYSIVYYNLYKYSIVYYLSQSSLAV